VPQRTVEAQRSVVIKAGFCQSPTDVGRHCRSREFQPSGRHLPLTNARWEDDTRIGGSRNDWLDGSLDDDRIEGVNRTKDYLYVGGVDRDDLISTGTEDPKICVRFRAISSVDRAGLPSARDGFSGVHFSEKGGCTTR
jgi:hypothetical protein